MNAMGAVMWCGFQKRRFDTQNRDAPAIIILAQYVTSLLCVWSPETPVRIKVIN